MKPSDKVFIWLASLFGGLLVGIIVTSVVTAQAAWLFVIFPWLMAAITTAVVGSQSAEHGLLDDKDYEWCQKLSKEKQASLDRERRFGLDGETWTLLNESDRAWLEGARAENQVDPLEEAIKEVRSATKLQGSDMRQLSEHVHTNRSTGYEMRHVQDVMWGGVIHGETIETWDQRGFYERGEAHERRQELAEVVQRNSDHTCEACGITNTHVRLYLGDSGKYCYPCMRYQLRSDG